MPQNSIRSPTEADRHLVQEIIDRHAADCPEEVSRVGFTFGEDWTGYPAVYLKMFVRKDMRTTNEKILQLNNYIKILHDDIIDQEMGFWPYSRTFEE